ncbi:MAG: hypothetical protein ABIH85_07540 [Candidatus Omnitrophota bacterium]
MRTIKKRSKMLRASSVLLCFVLFVGYALNRVEAKPQQVRYSGIDGTEIPADNASSEKANVVVNPKPSKDFIPEHEYGRDDPFNPNLTSNEYQNSEGMNLQGIVRDGEVSRAIINGSIVSVGDKIGNNTVREINEKSVIINDGTQDLEIRLSQKRQFKQ